MLLDSLWLKIDGFGADATPTATSKYLDAAVDFHALGVPLVADHIGGIPALSLLAFGAVTGIAHDITANKSFSSYSWRKPQERGRGGGGWRVYMPSLDLMLPQAEARMLLGSSPRARAMFANLNTHACPRGVDDIFDDPVRAFVVQRAEEVAGLGKIPQAMRPQTFLDNHVRPVTDRALAATRIDWGNNEAGLKLGKGSPRIVSAWMTSVSPWARVRTVTPPRSFAIHPKTRVLREGWIA